MATCPNGHENPDHAHFCSECGAPLVARPTPTTGHPSGKREHIKSPQRGDESKPVKRPDKSAAELLALAEAAEAEAAEAEARAAAAHARVAQAMASGSQPGQPAKISDPSPLKSGQSVSKRSAPKPRQGMPPPTLGRGVLRSRSGRSGRGCCWASSCFSSEAAQCSR